jgi:hypothetical protein
VSVGVDEDGRVAAPERLGRLAADGRACRARFLDDGVDLLRRARVVGGRDAAPAAVVLDSRIFRELVAVPQCDDRAGPLEERDVLRFVIVVGLPAEGAVERDRSLQVGDAERYE